MTLATCLPLLPLDDPSRKRTDTAKHGLPLGIPNRFQGPAACASQKQEPEHIHLQSRQNLADRCTTICQGVPPPHGEERMQTLSDKSRGTCQSIAFQILCQLFFVVPQQSVQRLHKIQPPITDMVPARRTKAVRKKPFSKLNLFSQSSTGVLVEGREQVRQVHQQRLSSLVRRD